MTGDQRPDFVVRIRPRLDAIAFLRLILRRTLPPSSSDDEALYLGVVTEIVANAMHAHHDRNVDEPIEAEVYARAPEPTVVVRDQGGGFDPDHIPATGTDRTGLGLRIARSLCPAMRIERTGNGTSVTLPYRPSGDESPVD